MSVDDDSFTDQDFTRAQAAQRRLQNFIFVEQQKEAMTAAVCKLSEKCFTTCYQPLSKRNKAGDECMQNCVNRYFDAGSLVMKRVAKKINKISGGLNVK
eukprot:CAMPEP_0170190810 /NCGR_PEP_ID=MMETSP0040_2-20121228/50184_1 /TAXON_ID=641309 /ORGANISM="Lotharella oceanica, Strain CCMP622" /LENGTH=98 /DNA_ID=CAMNT_0010438749 /DNA_START=59 /DNA_END=355 /DNA_ORIENTATION=+